MTDMWFVPEGDRLAVLPDAVRNFVQLVVRAARDYYESALTGVYLHGSASFGHFVARSSDLDFLIAVKADASADSGFFDAVVGFNRPDDVLGLEISVLGPDDLCATGIARPFRSHMALNKNEHRFVDGAGHPGDPDLVLHAAVCRVTGVSLIGPQPAEIFPEPERRVVLQALISELEWAEEDGDWTYAALNAARAWRYAEESVMASKLDGWLWVRSRTTGQKFIDRAMSAYLAPRGDHRVPALDVAGYEDWSRALIRHSLEILRTAVGDRS